MNQAGVYANNLSGDAAYKSFQPTPFPPDIKVDKRMMDLLVSAIRNLNQLDFTPN